MGYTHYIKPTRALTDEEWRRFTVTVEAIIEAADVPLGDWDGKGQPEVNGERVSFNGRGEDGHETCCIDRGQLGFSFCKTARKPYDCVVGAVYWVFQEIHGGEILSSDGNILGEEWAEARRLATHIN